MRTAAPLVFAALAQALNHIADRFFLARHSSEALAATLPGGMLAITFATFVITTIGYSGTVVAQRHGGGDAAGARRAFAQGLWLTAFALPLFLLTLPIGCALLELGGHAATLLAAEKAYFVWSTPSGFFGTLAAVLGGFLTGQGRTRRVGFATAVGFLANIAFDAVLIPTFGISGAGLALSLAAAVPVLILIPMIRREPLFTDNRREALRFNGREAIRILKLGLPEAVRCSSGAFFFLVFMEVAGKLGELTLSVGNVCFAVNNVLYMVGIAVSSTVTILTGRNTGAHDSAAERASIRSGLLIVLLTTTIFYAFVIPFSGAIMDAFYPKGAGFESTVFRRMGVAIFCIMFFRTVLESTYQILSAALKGRGNTIAAMLIEIGCESLVWMPLLHLAITYHPTMPTLWLTMPGWLLVAIILQFVRLRLPVRWRIRKRT